MYRDVLPFDASYKPQPGRLVGRNVKQKPGPLVGWLARDASSLADFAEAMEMASMLATTQLQDGLAVWPVDGFLLMSCVDALFVLRRRQ